MLILLTSDQVRAPIGGPIGTHIVGLQAEGRGTHGGKCTQPPRHCDQHACNAAFKFQTNKGLLSQLRPVTSRLLLCIIYGTTASLSPSRPRLPLRWGAATAATAAAGAGRATLAAAGTTISRQQPQLLLHPGRELPDLLIQGRPLRHNAPRRLRPKRT